MSAETYASLFAAGQRIAVQLAARWTYMLSDPLRPFASPAFTYLGSINGADSNTLRKRRIGLNGRNIMQPRADGASATVTAIDTAYVDCAVTPFVLARSASDLAKMTDSLGVFDPMMLAEDMFASYQNRWVALMASLLGGYGTPIGTTNTKLTLATFLAGRQAMEVKNNEGPLIFVGGTKAVTNLQNDLAATSGGAIQWLTQTGDLITRTGAAKGSFLGTDIYQTNRAPTMNAGVDVASAFLAPNAMAWADGIHPLENPTNQMYIGPVLFEHQRDALSAATVYVGHASLGFVEDDDDAGQTVQSQA